MARAVFQVRSPHVQDIDVNTGEDRVPRGHNKSLSLSEKITSLISCLPFIKPNQLREPTGVKDPYEIIFGKNEQKVKVQM